MQTMIWVRGCVFRCRSTTKKIKNATDTCSHMSSLVHHGKGFRGGGSDFWIENLSNTSPFSSWWTGLRTSQVEAPNKHNAKIRGRGRREEMREGGKRKVRDAAVLSFFFRLFIYTKKFNRAN